MLVRLIPVSLALALLQVALRFKDDADLARRLRARDAGAMRELYDRYGRLIYSVIMRMVRNSAAAEDLVQETFLRVWNRIQAFDQERGALGPWILTVARNRAIDYLRSTDGRMSAGTLGLERLEQPGQLWNFDDRALSLDRARRLKDAFEKLTPDQKTVVELAYYEGLSQTEMAERMKQPLGTVKTWIRSALKVLREQLSEAAIV
ncbi:MAG TPA: sigma-70 family RNA polymerase sigma factor [Bryobacteraceae bacterium]